MNKYVLYAILGLIVLVGLGYLAWMIKVAFKFIVLIAIVAAGIYVYRLIKKKF